MSKIARKLFCDLALHPIGSPIFGEKSGKPDLLGPESNRLS